MEGSGVYTSINLKYKGQLKDGHPDGYGILEEYEAGRVKKIRGRFKKGKYVPLLSLLCCYGRTDQTSPECCDSGFDSAGREIDEYCVS